MNLDGIVESAQGASTLEYEWTIPSKFMVGTQQGFILFDIYLFIAQSIQGMYFRVTRRTKEKTGLVQSTKHNMVPFMLSRGTRHFQRFGENL